MHTTLSKTASALFKNSLSFMPKRFAIFGPLEAKLEEQRVAEEHTQKSLFSPVIKPLDEDLRKYLQEEFGLKVNEEEKPTELRPFKKSREFALHKGDYSQINKENPLGKVNVFEYKGTKFTLVGPQYEFLPIKNLYKLLSTTKPSIIVLQVRPDQILKSIDLNPLNKDNKFSNRQYFSQLKHQARTVMPDRNIKKGINKELLKNGILVNTRDPDNEPKYKPYELYERVSTEAAGVAAFYGESRGLDIVLGDLPDTVYRQNIANSLTLLQLQNIFTHCSRELARYPDLQPQTPFAMACMLYPEIFVRPTDSYMCTLFEYMIHKGHKDIFAFVGYNQSQSIQEYLDKRKVSNLENELKITEAKGSIVRDLQGEEILEKHTLLDVMFHGKEILSLLPIINFKTTYEMIDRYADPQRVDSTKFDKFRLMHYQLMVKYVDYCEKEYESGKIILSREFLQKTGKF